MTPIFLKFPPNASDEPLAAFSSLVDVERENEIYALGPVRRLNLLLGANNSGKSRLLRALSFMPARRCIAEGAQLRMNMLVDCIGALANSSAFENNAIARWSIQSDSLVEYPGVDRSELVDLKVKFTRLAECPWLLWAFVAELRAYRKWLDESFGVANVRAMSWRQQVDNLSEAAGKKVADRIPPSAEAQLTERDREFVSELANHPFVRMACLAERLRAKLGTAGMAFEAIMIAPFADLMADLAQEMTEVNAPAVYIPVLRTAHILNLDQDEDIYRSAVKRFYGVEAIEAHTGLRLDIFTGMDLYQRFLADRGGRREHRKRFEAFEAFLGQAFFGGKTVDIVAQYASPGSPLDAHHIRVTIGESERELHHLGDGIQALIILLYPMFMAEPETWFFIDEPEIHLHPGLQRLFLETLMTNDRLRALNLRYFFTTHSNHFFDPLVAFSDDVSIFSTAQVPDGRFSISCRKAPSVMDLDLLGVRNASVLLANCTVWIEGIVDRLYLRVYLKAYAEAEGFEFREDIHYAFLEYGGSNIKHYVVGDDDLLKRQIEPAALSNRALVLADFDDGKDEVHRAREKAFAARDVSYRTTAPCVEIENTLSVEILRKVFRAEDGRLWPEKLKRLDVEALVFDESTLRTKRMGTYLQELFRSQIPGFKLIDDPAPTSSAGLSGKTLATEHKTALAKKVCELSAAGKVHWEMLSAEAQEITRAVVAHIRRSNGK